MRLVSLSIFLGVCLISITYANSQATPSTDINALPHPLECVNHSCKHRLPDCHNDMYCEDIYNCIFECGGDADCYADCIPIQNPSDIVAGQFLMCAIPCLGVAKRISTRSRFHQCIVERCQTSLRSCYMKSQECRNAVICSEACSDSNPPCMIGCLTHNLEDMYEKTVWQCAQQCLHA